MSKKIRVRPSRGQSFGGFIMGIVFVGIGLFIAIPVFGLFGFFWTLVAVVITVIHGINVFSDKGIATAQIDIEDTEGHDADPIENRLKKIDELYQKGMITREEYEEKRKQIIEEI